MICKKCKTELPEEAVFCFMCGERQKNLPKPKQKKRTRANGSGSVIKRGKTYTAVYISGWKEGTTKDGKTTLLPIRRTKGGFKTQREAWDYMPTLKHVIPKNKKITLETYWTTYQDKVLPTLSKSKQTHYRTAYKRLDNIKHDDISTLTIDILQQTVDSNTKTFYPAKDMKTILSILFDRAVAEGTANRNLAEYIVLPKLEETETEPFNENELRNIWNDYIKGNTFNGYVLLMIYSGMMPGELFDLTKEMINLETQQIIGCGKKTKKRKTVPIVIADVIVPVIQTLIEYSDSEKLLSISEEKFYTEFKEMLKRCDCRDILRPYSCRHTTASALAMNKDVTPAAIKEVMRHTKFSTTERYIQVDTSDILATANKISLPTQ